MSKLSFIAIDPQQKTTDEGFCNSCLAVTGLTFDDIQSFQDLTNLGRENLDHIIQAWRKAQSAAKSALDEVKQYHAKSISYRITQLRDSRPPAIRKRKLTWLSRPETEYIGSSTQRKDLEILRTETTTFRHCGWCSHAQITEHHSASGAPLKGQCILFGPDTVSPFSHPMTPCLFQTTAELNAVRHYLCDRKNELTAYLAAIDRRINFLLKSYSLASHRPILSIWRSADYTDCHHQSIVYFLDFKFRNPHTQQIYYIPTSGYVIRPDHAHWPATTVRIHCNIQDAHGPYRYFEMSNTTLQLMTSADYQYFRHDPDYFDFWLRHSTTDHDVQFSLDIESLKLALAGNLII